MAVETVLPGIYLTERPEGLAAPPGGGIGTILCLGTAEKGVIGSAQGISAERDIKDIFGDENEWEMTSPTDLKTPLGLVRGLKMALNRSQDIVAVRVADSNVTKATFNVKSDDASPVTICALSGLTEGRWAHDIDIYVEDSTEGAIIENEEKEPDGSTKEWDLNFNSIVRSVNNLFKIISQDNEVAFYDPIYYRTDTLDYAGAATDKSLTLTTDRLAQTFKTVSSMTAEKLSLSMKKTGTTVSGNIVVNIETLDTNGDPSGTLVDANATFNIDTATDLTDGAYADIEKSFTDTFTLSPSKQFAIVVDFSGVTFAGDSIECEVVNYNATTNPYYYEDGKQMASLDSGTTWTDTEEENSLFFKLNPVADSGDVGIRMRNWDDPSSTDTVGLVFFLNNPLDTDTVDVTYKVSDSNSKVKKITFKHEGDTEEFNCISGNDLARDINNASTGSLWFTAVADETNGANPPGINTQNGTKDYPAHPTGGNNGSEVSPADYITALVDTDILDVQIVVIASCGRYDKQDIADAELDAIHAAMQTHVESMETQQVERIAVLGMRAKTSTESVGEYISSADDSVDARVDALGNRSGRVIFCAPGIKVSDPVTDANIIMPGQMAACTYAGVMSSLLAWDSPTRETMSGAVDVEIELNRSQKIQLRKLNVSVIEKVGSIRIMQAVTTDPTGNFREVSVRRIVDYSRIQIKIILEAFIKAPNTEFVRGTILTVMVELAIILHGEGYITGEYSVSVYASRAQQRAGKVNVDFVFQPVYPINKCMVTIYLG